MFCEIPEGYIPIYLPGDVILVFPKAVVVAGLRLGKRIKRRAALAKRAAPNPPPS